MAMNGKRTILTCLFLLSAATLAFEISLSRLFSVAQFYHFAFMIVSIALLGFGSSGTFLALLPGLSSSGDLASEEVQARMGLLSFLTGSSILAAYLFINRQPFDSFSIAWDRKQAVLLALHYLALASPFFFSGMAVGLLLAMFPAQAGRIYASNLFGSALGCLLALLAPSWLDGVGTVILSAGVCGVSALLARSRPRQPILPFLAASLLLVSLVDLGLRLASFSSFPFLELHLSPYKSLSYALQHPGSRIVYQRWNAFSRIDVVRSTGIHSLPGLSYRYLQPPPPEDGLFIDGDELSPILLAETDLDFAGYLPAAVAFQLRPQAETLVLEPRGGLDILAAQALGARRITAVESNPLIVAAASHVYELPQVEVAIESSRSYARRTSRRFDIVQLSLASSYHPVRSGAYSLVEDYRYTVEAFVDMLERLNPGGILVVTRWLQSPPSESLRTFALAVAATERRGADPRERIVALRGYNTVTILAKNQAFTAVEIETIRKFAGDRAFDLVAAPGLRPDETNRYNILPEPIYSQAFQALLETRPRSAFFAAYPYDVSPPTDDHPFFGHYFKWSQASQVLSELGKTWQPFGGAGYFVILALLLLATICAAGLVLLPVVVRQRRAGLRAGASGNRRAPYLPLAYFGLIGFAYLLVEIPLLQRFILYLGHPSYAMSAVLFSLLLFSGLGSRWAGRENGPPPTLAALAVLVVLLACLPWVLPPLFTATLGFDLPLRMAVTGLALAPVGFLMGLPFPGGIQWMARENSAPALISWAWAVNGAASVVSAILAALLALTFGFRWVFWIGALCYAGAWALLRVGTLAPGRKSISLPWSKAQR